MKIYVLNASSRKDTGITDELSRTLEPLRSTDGPHIACLTLEDGPAGITTTRDSDEAAPVVTRFIAAHHQETDAGAFVVACFSDPGVAAAREFSSRPVLGIGEAGMLTALALGDRVGLIAVSSGSAGKNRRMLRTLALESRVAGHAALDLDYADLRSPEKVSQQLNVAAGQLTREQGANVLLFAGAGLARYRAQLEHDIGVPVVDPTQAAVGMAVSLVRIAAGEPVLRNTA
jgi:Asp/Glu/hydantoin racemase